MTGRDLIVYILSNHLEDEPVFKNGKFVGFLTVEEVAEQMNVGIATIFVWIHQKQLPAVRVRDTFYIPADFKPPVNSITV